MTSLDAGRVSFDRRIDDVTATEVTASPRFREAAAIPAYLREVYGWAYLNPTNVRLLDRELVVAAILWGNNRRLKRAALAELQPGQRVLQAAHVYGSLIPEMARLLGPRGRLDVIDVSPLQAALCRRKIEDLPQASIRVANAADPGATSYDAASSFFLLHELPFAYKGAVVDALLASVAPGEKAIFVDYHRPHRLHPLRGVMGAIFDRFEPFAKEIWHHNIAGFAGEGGRFAWRKETFFGGLYQKVVARRMDTTITARD